MTEIELKARVSDRASLIARLDAISHFEGSVARDDTYWAAPGGASASIRIRRETSGKGASRTLVTYKRKERRAANGGMESEVNEELETDVSDAAPLEAFLSDSGFVVRLRKHKDVMDWTLPLEKLGNEALPPQAAGKTATFELCSVPPLDDFLEIEILDGSGDADTERALQETLLLLLDEAGIPRSQIERRYYSELLSQAT